jgi:uncharacterized protein YbjT (DUF2867 family)
MALFAVVGGGRTGRRVTDRLLERGHEVRIVSRHAQSTSRAAVESVAADLATVDAEHPALAEVAGVVISVEPPYDAAGADAVLHRGVSTLAEAAASRDVRFIRPAVSRGSAALSSRPSG